MTDYTIKELILQLQPDEWRTSNGFSPEIEAVQRKIFNEQLTDNETCNILNDWIANHQPCLFGKAGARLGMLEYCILSESDLSQSDQFIQNKIQQARLRWLQGGLTGDKSAFVILALSQKIALSVPDEVVQNLARRICSLYLLHEIKTDRIYTDTIELELPGRDGNRWRWDVGVNYFSAQGDGRWWQDHRIPGGMAFSMNSVGHMVKSGKLAGAMRVFEKTMNVVEEGWRHPSIDSLDKALIFAMRTIEGASDSVSGKATELLPLSESSIPLPVERCPVEMPTSLSDKNYCEYQGYYHTDFTVPSEYFLPDVIRPPHIEPRLLDFSYIFDNRLSNPDFINMGEGRRVSAEEIGEQRYRLTQLDRAKKRGRAAGKVISEE